MMFALLLQVVWISPDVPGCCGCEDEEPPQPAVAGEWGEALSGLSVHVLMDSTRFDLGAGLRAGVGFRFDPSGVEVPPTVIDFRGSMFGANELTLRFERLGQLGSEPVRFEREPHHEGGPAPLPWQTCVALCDVDQMDWMFGYFLLTDEAEQIPPGRYAMIARFENDGGPMIVHSARRRMDPTRCWAPPESIWIGAIESAPIEIEIVDRPPTPRTVVFPTRIEIGCYNERQLWIEEDSTAMCLETVDVRPGYHFALRTDDAIYVEDAEPIPGFWEEPDVLDNRCSPHARRLRGSLGSPVRFRGSEPGPAFEWIVDLLGQGRQYRYRRKYTLFESSVAWHSHWAPQRGDYRVLAEHIVDASWTMETICREGDVHIVPGE